MRHPGLCGACVEPQHWATPAMAHAQRARLLRPCGGRRTGNRVTKRFLSSGHSEGQCRPHRPHLPGPAATRAARYRCAAPERWPVRHRRPLMGGLGHHAAHGTECRSVVPTNRCQQRHRLPRAPHGGRQLHRQRPGLQPRQPHDVLVQHAGAPH